MKGLHWDGGPFEMAVTVLRDCNLPEKDCAVCCVHLLNAQYKPLCYVCNFFLI